MEQGHRTIRREGANMTKITDEMVTKLNAEGYSDPEIAQRLHVATITVRKRRKKLGLPPRYQERKWKTYRLQKFGAIIALLLSQPLTSKEAANRLLISPMTTLLSIKALENEGLVTRIKLAGTRRGRRKRTSNIIADRMGATLFYATGFDIVTWLGESPCIKPIASAAHAKQAYYLFRNMGLTPEQAHKLVEMKGYRYKRTRSKGRPLPL